MARIQDLSLWLNPLNISLFILAVLALKIFYQIIYNHFFHPLAKFPGPFWGGVTRLWIAYHNYYATELETEYALHKKYGPVLRVTPSMLLVSDSTKLPEIYHRNANKSDFYVTGSFGETEAVLNMKSHKEHARFRKLIAGPYSFSNIRKLEYLIDARMEHWIDTMASSFAGTGKQFDFAPWAVYMAYDIITEIGFGAPLGFVDRGEDVDGLIQGFHDGMTVFGLLGRLHPFTSWFKTTWLGHKYLVATPDDTKGVGVLMQVRDRLIGQRVSDIRQGKTGNRVDLLQHFLDARTDEGAPLDMEYIKAEILLVLLAGADTTGTSFQAMMHYSLTHPPVYARMMAELDDATRQGHLPSTTTGLLPSYDQVADHCPYYIACLREAMRLCPSAPNIFPRVVSEPGLDLHGRFAPAGTEITCNPWLVHRDRALYGDDAEVFRPERWLKDPDKAKDYAKYNFTFGYGSRVCLGKDIATVELYKGPLQFFRQFTPRLVDETKAGRFVIEGGVGFWEDMQMTISARAPVV